MSINLSLLSNPKTNLTRSFNIDLSLGAIQEIKLKVRTGEPNILKINFNTELGEIYDLITSKNFTGLRLSQIVNGKTVFDMAFIEMPKGRKGTLTPTGEASLQYESLSSLLNDTEFYPKQSLMGEYRKWSSNDFF